MGVMFVILVCLYLNVRDDTCHLMQSYKKKRYYIEVPSIFLGYP